MTITLCCARLVRRRGWPATVGRQFAKQPTQSYHGARSETVLIEPKTAAHSSAKPLGILSPSHCHCTQKANFCISLTQCEGFFSSFSTLSPLPASTYSDPNYLSVYPSHSHAVHGEVTPICIYKSKGILPLRMLQRLKIWHIGAMAALSGIKVRSYNNDY
jgi:hypothetical protein